MKLIHLLIITFCFSYPFSIQAWNNGDNNHFKSDCTLPGLEWFPDAKFGIFIHMTLQNVPMTPEESSTYKHSHSKAREIASRLDLSNYDAKEQAKMFKEWGAQYVVLTTKHHVGFALFDGPDDFNVMNSSNVKRDIVREFVDALREEGIKVGIYFSLPDWTHPDYASVANEKLPISERKATRAYAIETDTIKWNRFVKDMHEQVRFLCTNYGKIDLLWFDGDWERNGEQWKSKDLAAMIYELQPECVVNNRLRDPDLGHYATPEFNIPLSRRESWWEYCMTPSDSWDGEGADQNMKTPAELIRIFSDVVGLGGNVLMNVVPLDKGALTEPQVTTLSEVGNWINKNSEAIFEAQCDFPLGLYDGPVTRKGKNLYLFVHDIPKTGIYLKGTQNNIKRASILENGKELAWKYVGGDENGKKRWLLNIDLPKEDISEYTTVVKLEFEDENIEFRTPDGNPYKL